jgi:hypothetical protein
VKVRNFVWFWFLSLVISRISYCYLCILVWSAWEFTVFLLTWTFPISGSIVYMYNPFMGSELANLDLS